MEAIHIPTKPPMKTNSRKTIACAALMWLPAVLPGSAAEKPDGSAAPKILCNPETQVIREHLKVAFTVQADNPPVPAVSGQFTYQWQRQGPGATNYVNIPGATNDTYLIDKVTTNDVAFYRVRVSFSNGTTNSEPAQLLVFTHKSPIAVYGSPVVTSGGGGTCPGPYAGLVNYRKSIAAGWGWVPHHNDGNTVHKGTDNNSSPGSTKAECVGYENDILCPGGMSVTTGHPGPPPGTGEDSKYRFTIYFPSSVPTNSYPITLDGFFE